MGYYAYPPFPILSGSNFSSFFFGLLEWVVEVPIIGIINLFLGLLGSFSNGMDNSTQSIGSFIGSIFNQSVASFSPFGIFAPVLASIIWGLSILILIFFVFKAFQLSIREVEED